MNRTTSERETVETLIRRRAKQSEADFEEAKAKFTEAFATNPKYAIEWHAGPIARAQVYYEWWYKVAEVLDRCGLEQAIEYAAKRVEIEVDSFFGSNSTCQWTNALRRAEAAVYHAIACRDLAELRAAFADQSR